MAIGSCQPGRLKRPCRFLECLQIRVSRQKQGFAQILAVVHAVETCATATEQIDMEDVLRFPPLIEPVRLRSVMIAFRAAIAGAQAAGEAHRGAGTLYYVGRFELIEFAIVLEPEEPLRLARKIFYAGMNALAEGIVRAVAPEKPITFRYPARWFLTARWSVAAGWRSHRARMRTRRRIGWYLVPWSGRWLPGCRCRMSPEITTLDEEGFDAWNPPEFAASFSRHFLVEIDSWHERGFAGIGPRYLSRLEKPKTGARYGIDENGDLIVDPPPGQVGQRVAFAPALNKADWYDPLPTSPEPDHAEVTAHHPA